MASMSDIQRRKTSIQSTGQITKAMKLVATVKLQKARTNAENSKPYFDHMYEAVKNMLSRSGNLDHKYLKAGKSSKKAVIVITSNRGLAGGYNSNVVKLLTNNPDFSNEQVVVYNVGRKGREVFVRKGYDIKEDFSDVINEPMYEDAMEISKKVLSDFENEEFGELYIAYTVFKNTVSHIPSLIKLLPVSAEEEGMDEDEKLVLMNYEPCAEEALDIIIPKYVSSLIYGALMESVASENGARMQAMDSATSNAEDMLADLSLLYNRARQSSITQELTEIIAGAEAIS
ncbi:MAG: ATP synthase F1 subunit gamma [Lachnospiraceae bacterium]|nr:ATP synthase F1 subunit gamma [Lachnospiraceae bacterium]MDE6233579.1 ATP synthase F1 subunit gamma [Lachnospiraceae bacterium]MDE6251239.1 ATP synthase F1 subunit gamma [Lachnospiraceae bacterium]